MLTKVKLNSLEVLISKTLMDSNISYDQFVLINNVLREYEDMKEEIISLSKIFYSICELMSSNCLKCRKNIESKTPKVVKTKNRRIMLLSKCELSDSEKPRFTKEQEASRF